MDNFQGKGRKHNQHKNENTTKKKTKRVLEKTLFDNFQGKRRKNNQNNTETKPNEKKRKGFENKNPGGNSQDHFRSKGKTMKMPKGGKTG